MLCREYASHNGIDHSAACSEFAQRMSITLERENARAVLRRLTTVGSDDGGCNSAVWFDDPVADADVSDDVVMATFQ